MGVPLLPPRFWGLHSRYAIASYTNLVLYPCHELRPPRPPYPISLGPALTVAEQYLELGWALVPVDRERKTPIHQDWPARAAARDFTPADFADRNVGVVLGRVSGDLVDIDLDSAAALELAPDFLPETLAFGRKSKPASHWLYTSPGLTAQKLWFPAGDGRELIEIRATNTDGEGCGHQTVFPGSVHPSGEAVEWADESAELTAVDAVQLRWSVARLAVAAAILNGWGEGSGRHEKSLGLAGGLLKAGWSPDEVRHCLAAVRRAAGDTADEQKDFGHDVETTIKAFAAGKEVQGFGTLVTGNLISEALAKDLERHAMTPERRAAAAQALRSGSPGRQLAVGLSDVQIIRDMVREATSEAAPATAAPAAPVLAEGTDPYSLLGDLVDLTVDPDPLDYIIEGLPFASGGKVNAIQAQPKGAKTPTALLLGACVATGLDFLGHKVLRPGPVLYLDAETGRLARIRYRRICRALGVDPKAVPFEFRDVKSMFSERYLATLEQRLRDRPARLVLIDTYGAMLDAKIDTNSPEFAHWARQLGVLSRTLEVVIVILIHEKKGGGKRGAGLEMIAGNYQGAGAFQAAIALVPTGERNEDPIEVSCSRAPEHDFAPFRIQWEDVHSSPGKDLKAGGSGLRAVRVDSPKQPEAINLKANEDKRVKVARALIANLEATPYQNKTKVVKGTRGADEKAVRRTFDDLVEAGVLLEAKTGERVNGKGEVEAVLVYSVAPLDKRVTEARMKLGIIE